MSLQKPVGTHHGDSHTGGGRPSDTRAAKPRQVGRQRHEYAGQRHVPNTGPLPGQQERGLPPGHATSGRHKPPPAPPAYPWASREGTANENSTTKKHPQAHTEQKKTRTDMKCVATQTTRTPPTTKTTRPKNRPRRQGEGQGRAKARGKREAKETQRNAGKEDQEDKSTEGSHDEHANPRK